MPPCVCAAGLNVLGILFKSLYDPLNATVFKSASHLTIFPTITESFSPDVGFTRVDSVNVTVVFDASPVFDTEPFHFSRSCEVICIVLLSTWVSSSDWFAFLPTAASSASITDSFSFIASATSLSVSSDSGAPPIRSATFLSA